MRDATTQPSCRSVQEENCPPGSVTSALEHTVDQPWAVHTQQVPGGTSTGPFRATTLPSGVWVMAHNTTGFCPHVQTHSQKALSFKWDTTFQHLSMLPMRKKTISSQPSTTEKHYMRTPLASLSSQDAPCQTQQALGFPGWTFPIHCATE